MIRFLPYFLLVLPLTCAGAKVDQGVMRFIDGFAKLYSDHAYDYFYVSPAVKTGEHTFTYIYWLSGNLIITVTLPTSDEVDYWWYRYKAATDLGTEVVPSTNDLKGSTYLYDLAWIEEKLRLCLLEGNRIVVERNADDTINVYPYDPGHDTFTDNRTPTD